MGIKGLTREDFIGLCERNATYNAILREIGLTTSAGNRTTLKKALLRLNIDYSSSFQELNKTITPCFRKKVSSDLLFVANSLSDTSTVKKRILQESLLVYCCEKCGSLPEWNGEKLVLQLDHKNGINNDHRIENLRFLCPNCHSQTATFGSRRFKKEKENTVRPSPSIKEHNIVSRKTFRPGLEILLDDINKLGYCGTGRKYGVSDNAIRKWIKIYEKYGALV